MARGRVLARSISTSEKVAGLSCDGARLLYTWMIAHQDPMGRLRGEPLEVKALVMPRHPSTIEDVEGWLGELAAADLIAWYVHQGMRYVAVLNPQISFAGNMKRISDLPGPNEPGRTPYVQRAHGVRTPYVTDVDVDVEGEVEGEGASTGVDLENKRSGRKGCVGGAAAVPPARRSRAALTKTLTPEQVSAAAKRFGLPLKTVQLLADKIVLEFDARGYKSAPSALLTWCAREAKTGAGEKPTNGVDPDWDSRAYNQYKHLETIHDRPVLSPKEWLAARRERRAP